MYLVDTNVISALAPGRAERSATLVEWMDRNADDLFLSVVTVGEIARGIAKLERIRAVARAKRLREWWELTRHLHGGRLLPFDAAAAEIAGALGDRAEASGHTTGFADIAIAATAVQHDLTVLTRNLRHFEPLGVSAIDPIEMLPP